MCLCIEGKVSFVGRSLVDFSEAIESASDSHYSGAGIIGFSVALDALRDLAETIKVTDELISLQLLFFSHASATRKLHRKLRGTCCGTELYGTIRRVVQSELPYTYIHVCFSPEHKPKVTALRSARISA